MAPDGFERKGALASHDQGGVEGNLFPPSNTARHALKIPSVLPTAPFRRELSVMEATSRSRFA